MAGCARWCEGSHRWTNGQGSLPASLLALAGNLTVEVHLAETELRYPLYAPTDAADGKKGVSYRAAAR